jgi:hypothetical protein
VIRTQPGGHEAAMRVLSGHRRPIGRFGAVCLAAGGTLSYTPKRRSSDGLLPGIGRS